ncbi:FimV N-terminal domain-containing protein [Halomonas shengliensis]|uniref:FimV N-terminal domain-containing protein n=1 Tax=Halomonas shengliensis TaxID=419597 RepID=A0A1H0ISF8_9GAMM|nr:FimV/HubP family polar landmark protein [Halomonas shengliensis]SDO34406.1 FimV N-terminal domain-containing protein [Halomonas shengliensis]
MKRKLTLAMLLSLSAASPVALGLGLGETDVRSTLNAPLRATIPLTDAGGIQPGLLNVTVADERAYAAAGLARTPLAASVRAEVARRQGDLVVDLTTERPVREPWLDLLLRFDWPTGQQVREVTLLLDPPNYDEMPALVAPSRQVAAPAPTPSREARRAAATRAPAPGGGSPAGDPAWVRSGDTLWAVAGRLRPDSGISMNQMMVALVAANPEVFPSGNINAMRAGFTLAVPDRERIAARSQAEADRIVTAMNQAWANRGGGAPARVPLGGDEAAATAVASAQQASTDTSVAQAAAPDAEPPSATDAEPATASEPGEAGTDAEGPEPRLTLLTDAELAAEQTRASAEAGESGTGAGDAETAAESEATETLAAEGDAGEARVEVDPELLAALFGDGELTEDQRLLRLESRWQQSQAELEAVQAERDELRDELGDMRQELDALRDQLARLGAGAGGAEGAGAGGLAAPAEEGQEAAWWGAFFPGQVDRNLMLGGAGLAALLALWLAVRRRRGREEREEASAGQVRVATPGASAPGAAAATPGEPAAADEQAPVERSVRASLPQAEAINEADIFIAYGRYDQARELLEASLAREPERDDLRLKLLGVHLEQGSREAAERELARLHEGGNPAVIEEAEGLMARHGLSVAASGQAAAEPRGDRAHFVEAAALPPRRFDEAGEEHAQQGAEVDPEDPSAQGANARGAEPRDDTPDGEPRASAAEDPMGVAPPVTPADPSAYRRPEPEVADETASDDAAPDDVVYTRRADEATTADGDPGVTPPAGQGEAAAAEAPAAGQEQEEALPEVPTRQGDDGREVIDYRPPSLDTSVAPREETPMQPSVDFAPQGLGLAEKGAGFDTGESLPRPDAEPDGDDQGGDQGASAPDRPLPEAWEVEEVSFPPLEPDNGGFSAATPSDRLAEAHRLVEAGEAGHARELLDELSRSDDPAIRDEALALRRRLEP